MTLFVFYEQGLGYAAMTTKNHLPTSKYFCGQKTLTQIARWYESVAELAIEAKKFGYEVIK